MKAALILFAALLVPAAASAKSLEWSDVQHNGGMTIGTPYAESGQWFLPVEADIGKLNSAWVCDGIKAHQDHDRVQLTLNTAVAGLFTSSKTGKCAPIALGRIKPGSYYVVYRSPSEPDQSLGQIDIKP
jgi:hypothetical protein